MAVLGKGQRNVEILKQPQYSPMPVEKQIAIIYCGTKGLLQKIPVRRIADFELEYLNFLEINHNDILNTLREGKLTDEAIKVIETTAKEIGRKYEA